jgi:hypothetical protein
LRKNIKEKSSEFQAISTEIKEAFGVPDVTFNIDWVAFVEEAKVSGSNDPGGLWLDVLNGIKKNMLERAKDDLVRKAVQSAWTTGVIRHREEADFGDYTDYHWVVFEGGDLVHLSKPEYFDERTHTAGDSFHCRLVTDQGLPLPVAVDIRDNASKFQELCGAIQQAFDLPVEVKCDIDWLSFVKEITSEKLRDKPSVVWLEILEGLKANFEKEAADEDVREAVREKWLTGIIRHREDEDVWMHAIEFKEGDLIHLSKPEMIEESTHTAGSDIVDKL